MRPGGRAYVVGLRAREELNGVEVALLQAQGERWAVRTVPSGVCVRVRPQNLDPAPGLHARLTGSRATVEALLLEQCDGPTLRAALATDRTLAALAATTLRSHAWRARTIARNSQALALWTVRTLQLSLVCRCPGRSVPRFPSGGAGAGGLALVAHYCTFFYQTERASVRLVSSSQ